MNDVRIARSSSMGVLTKQLRQFGESQLVGESKMVDHKMVLICVFEPKRWSAETYFVHNSCFFFYQYDGPTRLTFFFTVHVFLRRSYETDILLHYSCFSYDGPTRLTFFCIVLVFSYDGPTRLTFFCNIHVFLTTVLRD